MLILPGPVKVDLIFPEQVREWSPPWVVKAETLEAIDCHFWDWILWLAQKRAGGHQDQMAAGLKDMHRLMLAPMGVERVPRSLDEAVDNFAMTRADAEAGLRAAGNAHLVVTSSMDVYRRRRSAGSRCWMNGRI
jgi:hypothetical protein